MNSCRAVVLFTFVAVFCHALAGGEERDSSRMWRISVGGAFNGNVRTRIGSRNLPVPQQYVPTRTADDAKNAGSIPVGGGVRDLSFDGGGFIKSDNGYDQSVTENWKLPSTASDADKFISGYNGDGAFSLYNAYEEVAGSSFGKNESGESDEHCQYGASFELSRTVWADNPKEGHGWGIDFAAAFSYFFQRDVFKMNGMSIRTDEVRTGAYRTDVNDPNATALYDYGYESAVDGFYGLGDASIAAGEYQRTFFAPALGWDAVSAPVKCQGTTSRNVESSLPYSAKGDYRELEMLFLLRPWYDVTDWWRVFAEVGVGVSWGRFDSRFYGGDVGKKEKFEQWDVYGVAGLGTMLRYGDFDLSIDFIGRFLRDDLDVDGRYVHGSVDRSDWGFRVMVGYEF